MSELDPLPSELDDLFRAERAASRPSPAVRAAVRGKLSASVGLAPLGHAAAAATLGTTGKALATIAIIAGIGGGTAAIVRGGHETPSPAAAVARVEPKVERDVAAVAPSMAPAPSAQLVASPPPPSAPPTARSAPTHRAPVRSQRQLLGDAWQALGAHDPARALELVELDTRIHHDGLLLEEREALQVVALAQVGRESASAAATRFFAAHPSSVYRELVERALAQPSKETP